MSEQIELLVIGPGAMGCLYAGLMAENGVRVGLLDHRPERASLIDERGIILERDGEQTTVPVRCSADPDELGPADFALVCVKAYDTVSAMERALGALKDSASVLTLQNGLGNYEAIAEIVTASHVLAGTTTAGATLVRDGHLRVAARGMVQFGSPGGNARRIRATESLLVKGGIEHLVTRSVDDMLWAKAIMNAAINPLTALTGLTNGGLLQNTQLRVGLRAIVQEAAQVARRCGIFVREDIVVAVETVCEQTAENRSSMLQDIRAGNRTEIDFINGAIVSRAEERGTQAPLCALLTGLVHGLEQAGRDEE